MLNYSDWKKGMKVVLTVPMGMAKRGVLLTDSKYITTSYSGLYYADIQWEDGHISRNYMICRHSLKPAETRETEGVMKI